jgi:DNA repair protein RadC
MLVFNNKPFTMPIHNWPELERPREKLLSCGAETLSDAELLAILLRSGTTGKSAVDLARDSLSYFDGLRNLLNANAHTFCSIRGLGNASYAQLQAARILGQRYLAESLSRDRVRMQSKETRQYITTRLRHYQQEVFACLFLDIKHRMISFEKLFFGTIDTASIYPREVVKCALKHNAAAVIFAHNHPSGNADPSIADQAITRQLITALQLVDVTVLDHIIIGDVDVTSFAELGIMP